MKQGEVLVAGLAAIFCTKPASCGGVGNSEGCRVRHRLRPGLTPEHQVKGVFDDTRR